MFGMFVLPPESWSRALKFQLQPLWLTSEVFLVASGSVGKDRLTSSREKPQRRGAGGSHAPLQIFPMGICMFIEEDEDLLSSQIGLCGSWEHAKTSLWQASASPSEDRWCLVREHCTWKLPPIPITLPSEMCPVALTTLLCSPYLLSSLLWGLES